KLIYSGNKTYVYENQNALPRAYFVNEVQKATAIEILNKVKNNQFDPKEIAFVEDVDIIVDKPDSIASVKIEKYGDENIYLNVNASGNNFLFLGDTYVGKGWKAFVDEKETKIYKTNHNFRGIVVPAGNHKVHFEYLPESFVITKNVALVLSSLVVLGLFVSIGLNFRKKKEVSE
ncbi:MAG: YfhO family protein, partial [Ignavibacteriaceae bacterium]